MNDMTESAGNRVLFSIPFSAVITLFLIVVSCGDDSMNEITGPAEEVSYSGAIQPIFNNSCGGSGCHIESSASGVNLSSYSHTMSSGGPLYEREIVEPGNPDQSPLVDKVEPTPQHGQRMPIGLPPLSDQQIEQIRTWIEQGAMDN